MIARALYPAARKPMVAANAAARATAVDLHADLLT
jgi:hypothetical protein